MYSNQKKKNKNTDYKHTNVYPQQNSIHCIFKRNAKYMFTTFVENKDLQDLYFKTATNKYYPQTQQHIHHRFDTCLPCFLDS